jgi:AcrR family transcriptional regulator
VARRSGRRPGNPDTREAILHAARQAFAERGYDAASIRSIATAAGVDPALVHHYFGTKDQLFLATMNAPADPAELLPDVLDADPEQVGERFVRMFLGLWDSSAGTVGLALLRSAVSNEWTARLMREFLVTQVLRRLAAGLRLHPAEAPLRTGLVAAQMAGLVMVRYVVKLEPLASAPAELVVAAVAPTIQRYLTGELAGVVAPTVSGSG